MIFLCMSKRGIQYLFMSTVEFSNEAVKGLLARVEKAGSRSSKSRKPPEEEGLYLSTLTHRTSARPRTLSVS